MTIEPPTGLFEAHLPVSDLSRAVAFYRDVVGLEVAFELPERGAAFVWVGGPGHSMLGLWTEGQAPHARLAARRLPGVRGRRHGRL